MPKFYTVPEVCDILQIKRSTFYNRVGDGSLAITKIGKLTRVSEEDLRHFIEGCTVSRAQGSDDQSGAA